MFDCFRFFIVFFYLLLACERACVCKHRRAYVLTRHCAVFSGTCYLLNDTHSSVPCPYIHVRTCMVRVWTFCTIVYKPIRISVWSYCDFFHLLDHAAIELIGSNTGKKRVCLFISNSSDEYPRGGKKKACVRLKEEIEKGRGNESVRIINVNRITSFDPDLLWIEIPHQLISAFAYKSRKEKTREKKKSRGLSLR